MAETIYIIDPLPEELRSIADALASEPVVVKSYVDAVEFLDQVATTASGCVLVPLDLPGMGVRALMDEIKRRHLPLAVVVLRAGQSATYDDLCAHLEPNFAKWWLPDAVEFAAEIPRTSAGKFKKSALREQFRKIRSEHATEEGCCRGPRGHPRPSR